jgi:hypothetical protein
MIKLRRMKLASHVTRVGEKSSACRVLVGKTEGKPLLGRPRRKWKDIIKTDLRETSWGVDWIHLAREGSCEYGKKSLGSIYTENLSG